MSDEKGPGRPTDYRPEYAVMLLAYFGVDLDVPYIITADGPQARDFPSLAGFAAKIGVHRETLLNWSKDEEGKAEFAHAYRLAKDLQENFVIVNGNKGLLNTAFAIFTAKNVLGWRDRQPGETDVSVNVNNLASKPDDELDRRIAELERKHGKKPDAE